MLLPKVRKLVPRTVDNERDLVELDELRILRGLRVSYEQAVLYLGRHRPLLLQL